MVGLVCNHRDGFVCLIFFNVAEIAGVIVLMNFFFFKKKLQNVLCAKIQNSVQACFIKVVAEVSAPRQIKPLLSVCLGSTRDKWENMSFVNWVN